ncbi:MAG: hypothetical protein F9K38_06510 [Pseudorhodoplanes sp.]|nr:MAG: hypothetical protein F9K38_06510 [Pseudorhodoplanes sp.]
MPPLVLWTLGALGVVALARLMAKEYRRINDELGRARAEPAPQPVPPAPAKLKRDPQTGIYRPQ